MRKPSLVRRYVSRIVAYLGDRFLRKRRTEGMEGEGEGEEGGMEEGGRREEGKKKNDALFLASSI
jgi:hypothetical protein